MTLTEDQIFEHALVVSIDDKRLNAFRNNFILAGINKIPDHWHGAFIKKPLFKENIDNAENRRRYTYTQELCNGFSHYFIVVMAKYLGWPYVTIFEDDAVPIKDIHEKIKFYCTDIPDDVDIFKLGYNYLRRGHTPVYEDEKYISIEQSGSHAYMVFKKNYDKFISATAICPRADFLRINPCRKIKVYSPKISLFKQVNIPGTEVMHNFKQ